MPSTSLGQGTSLQRAGQITAPRAACAWGRRAGSHTCPGQRGGLGGEVGKAEQKATQQPAIFMKNLQKHVEIFGVKFLKDMWTTYVYGYVFKYVHTRHLHMENKTGEETAEQKNWNVTQTLTVPSLSLGE